MKKPKISDEFWLIYYVDDRWAVTKPHLTSAIYVARHIFDKSDAQTICDDRNAAIVQERRKWGMSVLFNSNAITGDLEYTFKVTGRDLDNAIYQGMPRYADKPSTALLAANKWLEEYEATHEATQS